jgi:hypothetical protein
MKYITLAGRTVQFKKPPVVTKRSLSFRLLSPSTWAEDAFLNIVWKHAGHHCTEIKLRGTYRDPVDTSLSHNYDLFFQIGYKLLEPLAVNAIVADIEADIQQNLKVDLKGRGHERRIPKCL